MPGTPVFLINIDNPLLRSSYLKAPYEGSFLKGFRTEKYLKFRRRKVSPAVKKDRRIGTGRFYEATFIFRLHTSSTSIRRVLHLYFSTEIRTYLTSKMWIKFLQSIDIHPIFSQLFLR